MTKRFKLFGNEIMITPLSEVNRQQFSFHKAKGLFAGLKRNKSGQFSKHPYWGDYGDIVAASRMNGRSITDIDRMNAGIKPFNNIGGGSC